MTNSHVIQSNKYYFIQFHSINIIINHDDMSLSKINIWLNSCIVSLIYLSKYIFIINYNYN